MYQKQLKFIVLFTTLSNSDIGRQNEELKERYLKYYVMEDIGSRIKKIENENLISKFIKF